MSDENIRWLIEQSDIEWEMDWSERDADGNRKYPDDPEKEMTFERDFALAHLILNGVVSVNENWWKKDWPEEARKSTALFVNCGDVFAWGGADTETCEAGQIEDLYRMWRKDSYYGHIIWCIINRKQMPQKAVEDHIKELGVWDLDAIKKEHGLKANYYSGRIKVSSMLRWKTCVAWARGRRYDVVDFNDAWRLTWDKFVAANPDWKTAQFDAEEQRLLSEWSKENGY